MSMRVRIHRGAHEIGGSCLEVEAAGSRIVLDVGRPLSTGPGDATPLPPVAGFAEDDPSLVGVLISHAHQDHWGLAELVPAAVPIYMGEATHRILGEAAFWSKGLTVKPAGFLRHREPFRLGPFTITPYLNDHSAFDAYSLLVEAAGRRLFYTGDLRGHGRKHDIFEQLLRRPPRDVDVLLLEGTNVQPDPAAPDHPPQTEAQVEQACVRTFKATDGLVLALYSAQHIDRLVTLYRAALQSGRDFVMDLYGASIAAATENQHIPRPGAEWPRVRVYVPPSQRRKVKDAGAFWRVEQIKPFRIFEGELAQDRSRYVLTFRPNSVGFLERAGCLDRAQAVWSMWPGYLDEPSGVRLASLLGSRSIPLTIHHTSGHASIPDLQRLAKAIAPKALVPIHSFGAHRFQELFDNVAVHTDGQWWSV
jgi:ribonuclease J